MRDRLSGPFRRVAWHWRLCPGEWRLAPDGAEGPAARITAESDAPLRIELVTGWESPAYGAARPAPVLRVEASAPVAQIVTRIALP